MKHASPKEHTPPRYISAAELRMRFSPPPSLRTIRAWTRARLLPSIKLGGLRYFDEIAIAQIIERRLTVHSKSQAPR